MNRLDEIQARCDAGRPVHISDVKYLLADVKQTEYDYDEANRAYHEWFDEAQKATARAEKAEAERDEYKKELKHLEHMVSVERDENGKRGHSIGVAVAIKRARELLAQEEE